MSLREHLRKLLPEILPPAPKNAIKGTELIELVKLKLDQKYSDATLRYHFSIMSCDPSSPIAKVEHGQGYYLRTNTLTSMKSARHMLSPSQTTLGDTFGYTTSNEALLRANKFRSIVSQSTKTEGKVPFILENTFGEEAQYEDLWKYPDLISVSWKVGVNPSRSELDEDMLNLQRSFGSQPFTLKSMKMKLEIRNDTYREDFFQCLSNSRWAHYGELLVAAPIEGNNLINNLRSLGNEFGIGITSYGLPKEVLDDLSEPGAIQHFTEREIEDLFKLINYQKIAESRPRNELAWEQVNELRNSNAEIDSMFKWLSQSLEEGKVMPLERKSADTIAVTNPSLD
ncbi:MAG: hypothetical protein VYC63_07115 [Verrucomicrobiota bacterium]|nr:hypothetical protein [Verrucomicrobiota bacterium]